MSKAIVNGDAEQKVERLRAERDCYKDALTRIARYDRESIWRDDRDDAADDMLEIARLALEVKP